MTGPYYIRYTSRTWESHLRPGTMITSWTAEVRLRLPTMTRSRLIEPIGAEGKGDCEYAADLCRWLNEAFEIGRRAGT